MINCKHDNKLAGGQVLCKRWKTDWRWSFHSPLMQKKSSRIKPIDYFYSRRKQSFRPAVVRIVRHEGHQFNFRKKREKGKYLIMFMASFFAVPCRFVNKLVRCHLAIKSALTLSVFLHTNSALTDSFCNYKGQFNLLQSITTVFCRPIWPVKTCPKLFLWEMAFKWPLKYQFKKVRKYWFAIKGRSFDLFVLFCKSSDDCWLLESIQWSKVIKFSRILKLIT